MSRGRLRGYATVTIPITTAGDGITFYDCPAYRKADGTCFVALPNRPQLDRDGRQHRDANGKPAYSTVAEFSTRALQDRFSAAAVAAIEQHHPGAFGGQP